MVGMKLLQNWKGNFDVKVPRTGTDRMPGFLEISWVFRGYIYREKFI